MGITVVCFFQVYLRLNYDAGLFLFSFSFLSLGVFLLGGTAGLVIPADEETSVPRFEYMVQFSPADRVRLDHSISRNRLPTY